MTTSPPATTATAVTAALAEFAAGLSWEQIPEPVRDRAVLLVTDTLASIVGAQLLDSTLTLAAGLGAAGLLGGTARVPGRAGGCSPYAAALLSGAAAHSLDFDDTHAPAQLHPGAPVIAAALAAAQSVDADERQLITGVIAGYETMTRVSYGLDPDAHARRGFHLTATTGVFGAAAAAGSILGLTPAQLEHAWGTCLSLAAGSGQFLVNGAWTKRFHVGAAAASGYLAAELAAKGFTGAAAALEGRDGFYNLYSPSPRPDDALQGLGGVWETMAVGLKPYPCCRAIHAPLDAVFELLGRGGFTAGDIEHVLVGMPERCVAITGEPQERKRDPHNVVDCQFSVHLCLALALTRGRVAFADYPDALADAGLRELMGRIDAVVDAEADAEYPQVFPGRVRITLRDGRVLSHYVRVPLGEPENMLPAPRLREKFMGLAAGVLGETGAGRLFDHASELGRQPRPVAALLELGIPVPIPLEQK
ncbi:MmgE/PrpD family protein [Arthrobacter sp. I2-34]|uniref:MmgE/PrpD family protein n=1 Tax=Arthrobacter hankyongi TaxID=2904801 RepID=A0ABS9L7H5_9MICC|nr:MmgE/PrpD family protein [Arthrobacter hankyongi]MCG2622630.1 MmgE/PrpD family protein [Arthrobacter hankyongi]